MSIRSRFHASGVDAWNREGPVPVPMSTAGAVCTLSLRKHARLRRPGFSRTATLSHSNAPFMAGLGLASRQHTRRGPLQPQQPCVPASWPRLAWPATSARQLPELMRLCGMMHACTHTVLMSASSALVIYHALMLKIATIPPSLCCGVHVLGLTVGVPWPGGRARRWI